MGSREWASMNDQDFEAALESCVSDSPPEDVVAEVTPWKRAMKRVLTGMALCAITLNFWCLDYILPAIGMVLLLLGFRALRHENRWFRNCFVITVIRAAYFFTILLLNTTIVQRSIWDSPPASVLVIANLSLPLIEFFCLWRGLRAVQQKVDLPPRAGGAVALMIWQAFLCILAAVRYTGLVIPGAMILAYIFIIRSIYKLSKGLDEAGYSIRPASVKVTDRCIVLVLAGVLIVGGTCGYLFGGSYPMDWIAVDGSEHTEVEDIKAHLIELGFPAYVLNDLRPEDIAACDGALQVMVDVRDETLLNGRVISAEYGGGEGREQKDDDVQELRITGVGVQVPGEQERWILFHHFLWTIPPNFYGTESIQLWPAYQNASDGWASDGEATGRVLYDNDGKTFAAPYHSLGDRTFTSHSIFRGEQTNTDIFAAFSMPAKGDNCRGYVAYPIAEIQDGGYITSWINYTHQQTWLQYPAKTAMETRMTNSSNDAGAFRTIQKAFQIKYTQ